MDFLHAAIINAAVAFALAMNFFTSGSFAISFFGLVVCLPNSVLAIVYLVAYLKTRGNKIK